MTNRLKTMADNVSITLLFANSTYFFFFYMYETVNSWTEAAMLCSQVTLRLYPLSPVL